MLSNLVTPPSKDSLIKMPLTKLRVFLHTLFLENKAQIDKEKKQLRNDAFHVKTSQSAKN